MTSTRSFDLPPLPPPPPSAIPDVENPARDDDVEVCANLPPATTSHHHHHHHHHHVMERRLGELAARRLYTTTTSTITSNQDDQDDEEQGTNNNNNNNNNMNTQGVTVLARHIIQPGKEDLFYAWIREISQLQKEKYPGFGGAQVVRPTAAGDDDDNDAGDADSRYKKKNEYVSIFRYENYNLLQAFMDSEDRRKLLEKSCEFEAVPIELTYHSLEYWFMDDEDSPNCDNNNTTLIPRPRPPPKPKMVVVTFLLIWVQAHFIWPALGHMLQGMPPLAVEAFTIFLIVLGTTYLWMPIITRYILSWWLFPVVSQKRRGVPAAEQEKKEEFQEGDQYYKY